VAANTGGFTIQVASLKDPAAADRLVADLKQKGYPAHLAQITMADKGTWYRIRVGRYKNRYQAAADMDRLKRSGNKPILVQQAP
jgi:cell division septation protein DedD